jgi:hypothetical protein
VHRVTTAVSLAADNLIGMGRYLEEFEKVVRAREEFNARTEQLHQRRGVPPELPLVAHEGDAEMMEYMNQGLALLKLEREFADKYWSDPSVDPHTIE